MTDKPEKAKAKIPTPKELESEKRERAFPIRNFARLLDQFLVDHQELDHGNAVTYLLAAVDADLAAHAKR